MMFVVAGASGRIGGVVAGELLARGHDVRALLRGRDKAQTWRQRGVDVAIASLDDATKLGAAFAGAGGVFVLLPEDPSVAEFHAHRRRMADAIATAVKQASVPHVVFLSTTAAYLPEGNGPANDLHYAENALRATQAVVTVLRATYLQENVLAALPAARNDGVYPNFLPDPRVCFPTVATRDVAEFVVRCLIGPPKSEAVDVLGPAYSVSELARELGAALGKELRVVDIPPAGQLEALMSAKLPRQFAEAVVEMLASFGSGRISPHGDRSVSGTTTVREVIQRSLG